MIKINALGTQIYATNEGAEINPPSYRTEGETVSIQAAYEAGNWEPVPDPEPPPSEPDWDNFIAPFTQPAFAGSMYDIIETKVQNAQITAQTEEETRAAMNLRTHWVNTSLVLLSGGPTRTTQWLSSAWLALLDRLLVAKQPLSQAEIEAVEALFAEYSLL